MGPKFDLTSFQELLLHWPDRELPVADETTDPVIERLLQILSQPNTGRAVGIDFMVLMRQLLLAHERSLSLIQNGPWPTATQWEQFGMRSTPVGNYHQLQPLPWQPAWLQSEADLERLKKNDEDLLLAEHQARPMRHPPPPLPMDPFLDEVTGYGQYLSPGQREALYSLLFLPAGETLIVCLPTGSGKSLLAQAPVLLRGLEAGLTLVVVPTTALAIDLARRTTELLQRQDKQTDFDLAWHSGFSTERREVIKKRIRNGNQGILFCSPEAFTTSLLPTLYKAAEIGQLAWLVIDEAHLVAQWGDDFRPAFQALAGVRRGLLQASEQRLRTVLMSATLSTATLETLDSVFGSAKHTQMLAAVHLRPEPRYFAYRAQEWEEKRGRVLELMRHVPRPAILYTTEREHVDSWHQILRDEGYRRLACFHGKTPNDERKRIIDAWQANKLDVIIATSAFGVGMDKGDVRSIIHSGVPETLDRYYQEVGRGGRDGGASSAIAVFTQRDIGIARSMSSPTLLSDNNAYDRWQTLFQSATKASHGHYLLNLDRVPPHLPGQSDYNHTWNMRTLLIMARAGLIELDSIPPASLQRQPDEDQASFEHRREQQWQDYTSQIMVHTLDPRHLDPEHFHQQISTIRERTLNHTSTGFNQLLDALDGRGEVGQVLTKLFTVSTPGRTVIVSRACRGCPAEGYGHSDQPPEYRIPPASSIARIDTQTSNPWQQRFPLLPHDLAVILYPDCAFQKLSKDLSRALEILVSNYGVCELLLPDSIREQLPSLQGLHRHAPGRLVILRRWEDTHYHSDPGPPLARATLLPVGYDRPLPDDLCFSNRPLNLVFAPPSLPSEHPLRLYRDTEPTMNLTDFLQTARQ